jgi:Zn-finger nucleic acid-binding protein
MQSVDLNLGGRFYIERCDRCLGLFFDPAELKRVLEVSNRPAHQVDRQRLQVLIEEEYHEAREQVRYIKCPACGTLMNRKSYGAKSGVIMDSCKQHGVWLDGGELAQIVKWKQAGGKLLDREKKEQRQKAEERRKCVEKRTERIDTGYDMGRPQRDYDHPLVEILEAVLSLW